MSGFRIFIQRIATKTQNVGLTLCASSSLRAFVAKIHSNGKP
jgi:hypothetical protein